MAEAYSYESFAGIVDTSIDCLYNWEKDFPEFFEAKKRGIAKSLVRHERMLNTSALNRKMNPVSIIYGMKCRFRGMGWNPAEVKPDEEIDLEFE